MTRARKAVLDALRSAEEPLSAAGVIARIGDICDQATVYRALSYLEETGSAESFVLHCARDGTERYYIAAGERHHHWFHCESCHRFIDLGVCRLGRLCDQLEREFDVRVTEHTLYFSGLCGDCRK